MSTLDILVIPGKTLTAMYNEDIKQFIIEQTKNCRYVTSVCTGAFLLAERDCWQEKGPLPTIQHG